MKKSENKKDRSKQIYAEWVTKINSNFMIRYKYHDDKKTSLIGAGRFWVLFDSKIMANIIFNKVWKTDKIKNVLKYRRGLVVEFIAK